MNNLSFKKFTPFIAISLIHLLAMVFDWYQIGVITKPLLLISLISTVYIISDQNILRNQFLKWLLLALICSLLGDTFLLLEKAVSNPLYFYFGLGSFLIAHLFYITLFKKIGTIRLPKYWMVLYILYYLLFLYILLPGMALDLKIPIVLYGAVLCLMAWNAWRCVSIDTHGTWVVIGAILFVISDSIIAIRKFKMEIAYADFLIMLTYILAQFFIVYGVLAVLKKKQVSI